MYPLIVPLKLAAEKPLPAAAKFPSASAVNKFQFLHPLGIGGVGLYVVLEIPTGILIEHNEKVYELAVHIFRSAIGPSHAPRSDDDRPYQPALQRRIAVRVIKPNQ